ncbi:hypothetical protein ES707_09191 [subsurface metagenome]
MPEIDKAKILAGRKAVDAYRQAHSALHTQPCRKGIPEEHTPLLNIMVKAFKGLGFNTIQEFFDASELFNLQETGIFEGEIRRNRKDLSVLGISLNTPEGVFAEDNGAKIKVVKIKGEKEAELYIDNLLIFPLCPETHIAMRNAIDKCPVGSRVFTSGLGLALVLLYLAQSGKAAEVIICEIDERVIKLVAEQVTHWFANNYPDFNLTIIKGDAYEEIGKHGLFDWIFIDLSDKTPPIFNILAQPALTDRGVYTGYKQYEPMGWK